MNKNKWMTMAAVLALSTSLAIAAPHGGKGGGKFGGKHGRGEFGERFAEKLNLTDAQKEQIKTIRTNNREQNKAFFEQSRATFEQFREAKKANDTAKLEQLKPALERQRAQMKQFRDAERQQILALLTPEQRTKFDALEQERAERRGVRGQRGHRNRQ
ncbi:MAG TPA: Spy/CpxP family protein refolding chaperone [Thermoanaerobaculia bacterium]|nr:Spy/CpxP family protein refolding chaperone [Thermoanaerobaculia bacterium]